MSESTVTIRPRDFDPYRDEIRDCACDLCNETSYAMSNVLDFSARRHLTAVGNLLTALRDGTHRRKTRAEFGREAREAIAARVAELRAAGASESEIAAVERGYVTVKMSDFYGTGMGLGIGPRGSR